MISTRYMNESETKKVKKAYKTTRKQDKTTQQQENKKTQQQENTAYKTIQ